MPRKSLSQSGESPVLRARVPHDVLTQAQAKALRCGVALPDVVRALLAWWTAQPDARRTE